MEVKRGEIYYIRYDNSTGAEMAVGRPAIVVSSDKFNETSPIVTTVFMTTSPKTAGTAVKLWTPRRQSWALCDQIQTYDKSRMGDRMCRLTKEEMDLIDEVLGMWFGLTEDQEARDDQREEEIAALKEAVMNHSVDCDYYKRAYEKVLAELVEERVARKVAEAVASRGVVAEPVKEPVEQPTEEKVDINRCSVSDLLDIGFKTEVAMKIIAGRPYLRIEDIRKVSGVTRIAYQIVAPKIVAGVVEQPVKVEKPVKAEAVVKTPKVEDGRLNINTATAKEIAEALGVSASIAYTITGYRTKHGPYKSVSDLANVKRISKVFPEKYGHLLTVG